VSAAPPTGTCRRPAREEVASEAVAECGRRVLEVGCGTGDFAARVKSGRSQLIVIDLARMVELSAPRGRCAGRLTSSARLRRRYLRLRNRRVGAYHVEAPSRRSSNAAVCCVPARPSPRDARVDNLHEVWGARRLLARPALVLPRERIEVLTPYFEHVEMRDAQAVPPSP
jgi:hypothetical protein